LKSQKTWESLTNSRGCERRHHGSGMVNESLRRLQKLPAQPVRRDLLAWRRVGSFEPPSAPSPPSDMAASARGALPPPRLSWRVGGRFNWACGAPVPQLIPTSAGPARAGPAARRRPGRAGPGDRASGGRLAASSAAMVSAPNMPGAVDHGGASDTHVRNETLRDRCTICCRSSD